MGGDDDENAALTFFPSLVDLLTDLIDLRGDPRTCRGWHTVSRRRLSSSICTIVVGRATTWRAADLRASERAGWLVRGGQSAHLQMTTSRSACGEESSTEGAGCCVGLSLAAIRFRDL